MNEIKCSYSHMQHTQCLLNWHPSELFLYALCASQPGVSAQKGTLNQVPALLGKGQNVTLSRWQVTQPLASCSNDKFPKSPLALTSALDAATRLLPTLGSCFCYSVCLHAWTCLFVSMCVCRLELILFCFISISMYSTVILIAFSALTLLVRHREEIRSVIIEWWAAGVVICLERGADCLHMVQLMSLHLKTTSSLASF